MVAYDGDMIRIDRFSAVILQYSIFFFCLLLHDLQPYSTAAAAARAAAVDLDFSLGPTLSPILDNACKLVQCGKGTCKVSGNFNYSLFPFECECEPGWKKLFNASHLSFMPCIIPDCTLDFSCMHNATAAPSSSNSSEFNMSSPCSYAYCGGGTCSKKSDFEYRCDCADGYANLLNVPSFPCLTTCAIGANCSHLGLQWPTPPPPPPRNNAPSRILSGNNNWFNILISSVVILHV